MTRGFGIAILTVLSAVAPGSLSAQQTPAAASRTAAAEGRIIAGQVVSAKSGQALADASVTLLRTKDRSEAATTTTDSEGRFAFPQLADGKYSLQAAHRGYVGAAYDEHENGSTAIVTGPGQETTSLVFKLVPQGSIFGVVAEDSGDPVPNASIAIYRQDTWGTGKFVQGSSTSADEQGNYELSNLAPGNYYISVAGTPWYANRRQSRGSQSSAGEARSPLDVAYPATFYPDATDQAYAAPLALAAGERTQINFTLHPVPSLHITLQIPSAGNNMPMTVPQLRQNLLGHENYVQAAMSYNTPDAKSGATAVTTVELSGIAPGQYDLTLMGRGGQENRQTSINVSSDQSLDIAGAASLAEVSGKLTPEGAPAAKLPSQLFLILASEQDENHVSAKVSADGSFHLNAVPPGSYLVMVRSEQTAMSISHLAVSGATIQGRVLKIGADPVSLTGTVAECTASISGFAKSHGKPASGVFLLLAPKDSSGGAMAWWHNQSDSDGSFDFPQLQPGQYTLIAVQDGWELDWSRPETLARYLPGALAVAVPPHSGEIHLPQAVEVQPK